MHKSLLYRLGPVKNESETMAYNDLKEQEGEMEGVTGQLKNFRWAFCIDVSGYTTELRTAAVVLNGTP
jgi:hypothetical protein